jgi:hypothetical protein
MTLIVEDGSVVPNAESYCTVAFADTYLASVGKGDAWDAADDKEVQLRLGAYYMLAYYRNKWAGYRWTVSQSLDWPRAWVPIPDTLASYGPFPYYVANNIVPLEVQRANAELACRAITEDIIPDVSPEDMATRVKLGQLEIDYSPSGVIVKAYRQIDFMLAPYLVGAGAGMVKLVRT